MKRVEIIVVGIAMALHGGFLGVARWMPETPLLTASFKPQLPMDVTFVETESDPEEKEKIVEPEVVENDEPEVDDENKEEQAASAIVDDKNRTAKRGARGRRGGGGGGDGEPGDGTGEPGDGVGIGPAGPDDEWSEPGGDGPPGDPRVGSLAASIAIGNSTAPAAPTQTPKTKKVDRDKANVVIKDELRKKDKELGLDLPAAGTIASLIKSAMQASDAPGDARATFVVSLGPGGKVNSVQAVSFAGGSKSTYDGIAASVKAALASQKLTLTGDYAKGATVSVAAVSKMRMPSGAKTDAGIELSLTQTFDVADIGAKPVRVVTVSFSSSPVK